jgi:hypothetical protein
MKKSREESECKIRKTCCGGGVIEGRRVFANDAIEHENEAAGV